MMKFGIVCIAAVAAAMAGSTTAASTSDRVKGAFFGALVGDAMCLGTHYEYSAEKIKKFYGKLDRYYAPGQKTGGATHGVGWGSRNYHGGNGRGPPKRAGEQTDYGDYNIVMLDAFAEKQQKEKGKKEALSVKEILPVWKRHLRTWRAWMCTQTRKTLEQVNGGMPLSQIGGYSNAMAIRHAAAYAYHDDDEDAVVASARAAMFTHRETSAHQGNEFFARVTHRILHKGLTPEQAIDEVAAISSSFVQGKVKQAKDKLAEATDPSSDLSKEAFVDDIALTSMARLWDVGKSEPIRVGKASPTEGTLPGSVYFILKYSNDFYGAIVSNSMVGGDNASRGVAIGMVLGAYLGVDAIPEHLQNSLVEWKACENKLVKLPYLSSLLQTNSEL